MSHKNKFLHKLFVFGAMLGLVLFGVSLSESAFAQVATYSQVGGSGSLKVGSRGESVRALQQFLASNADIYPSGLATGYYGTLTKNAVVQFQLAYDLTADGIAGPATKAKMNSLILAGKGLDIYAPVISNASVLVSGRNATVSFNTNEPVTGSVYYGTQPIGITDAGQSFGGVTVSGAASNDATFSVSKQISLANLSANSNYNYAVMVADASGNISLVLPKTFTTGQ